MGSLGHLTQNDRVNIISDLLDLDMPLEDIVDKYEVTLKTIYLVARRDGVDMTLRGRLIKMMGQRRKLKERYDAGVKQLRDQAIKGRTSF